MSCAPARPRALVGAARLSIQRFAPGGTRSTLGRASAPAARSLAGFAGSQLAIRLLRCLCQRNIGSSTAELCASSANEDRQSYSPTDCEAKFEGCFLHAYLLGLKCCVNVVVVVRGNLTHQSDGPLGLLYVLIKQAELTIGLLAPMLPRYVMSSHYMTHCRPASADFSSAR
jgi:hypothetical protein